ncbi:MAG: glycoside hydrolase family 9 protein [Vallitaleaceae bacterium]|nr:glycoside hydrolase family 9 protein [Vallitaleaceae bacterium]
MGIFVNQIGYGTEASKKVIYTGNEKEYIMKKVHDGEVVFRGSFGEEKNDSSSGDLTRCGDFTAYKEEGLFQIEVQGECSLPFEISNKRYKKALDASLKAFYYQRCGIELEEKYAGLWKHAACHLQKSYLYHPKGEELLLSNPSELVEIDTSGGWHDAGDYGRYVVAAAKAIADLLYAYLHFEKAFQEPIGIPESNVVGSDLLHEVKVELEWMFKMQREDGAVYTKVATRFFPGMIMPEEDTEPLFVFDVSTPATADFAAAMALASRSYQGIDQDLSERCLKAARKAYQWLMISEQQLFTNPENINSGEYGDQTDLDERFWAAAELYETTGEEFYHNEFCKHYEEIEDVLSLGWADVGGYGSLCYITSKRPVNAIILEDLTKRWLAYAKQLQERSEEDGYGVSLKTEEYIWGSNMVLLNQTMVLIVANQLLQSSIYDVSIYANIDYLFGKNPMNISYVSGMGTKSIQEPHHRPSVADEVSEPVPGLVSGGPCQGLYDDAAKAACQNQAPAKCFVDHLDSYSTNEITIYWNSPLVYVLAYLDVKE